NQVIFLLSSGRKSPYLFFPKTLIMLIFTPLANTIVKLSSLVLNLYLDTSNNLQTVIILGEQPFIQSYQSPRAQHVMGALLAALAESGKNIQARTSISIHPGPGSCTGLRVGFALVNALSLALTLPVKGRPA